MALSSPSSSASPPPYTAAITPTHALLQPTNALHTPLLLSSSSLSGGPLATLYEDSYLKLTPTHLKVKCYYFPLGLAKTIPLKDIHKVSLLPLGSMWKGQYKHWGMGIDFHRWWPSDLKRACRTQFIEVDCGKWPRIAFTIDEPEKVYGALSQVVAAAKAGEGEDYQQQQQQQQQGEL